MRDQFRNLEFLQDVLSGLNVRQDNYLELRPEFDDMELEYESEVGFWERKRTSWIAQREHVYTDPIEQRLDEIKRRMAWMSRNLEGCDWCCGGGDEEWAELQMEEERLLSGGLLD